MRLTMVQFVDPRTPDACFHEQLGTLAALLADRDVHVSGVRLAGYQPARLREAIIRHRPERLLLDLPVLHATAAHRTLTHIANTYALPVAVCGTWATCKPSQAISLPGVRAVILGEYEVPAAELLGAWARGQDPDSLPGAWLGGEGQIRRGGLAELPVHLDDLPQADRELFADGRPDGEIALRVGRGCPHRCSYCVNEWYASLYETSPHYVRRKSVDRVLAEIDRARSLQPAARSVKFYDHAFAMDAEWLEEFAAAYPQACDLPYRCHARLSTVTEQTAELLASSRCRWVHTLIGSGSRFVAEEILGVPATPRQMRHSCQLLRNAGLDVAAEVFVGSPYESDITLEETLELLDHLDVDLHPRVFFPPEGTRSRELCVENGWVARQGEADYWKGRSVLSMPSMPPGRIESFARKLPALVRKRRRTGLTGLLGRIRSKRTGQARDLRRG